MFRRLLNWLGLWRPRLRYSPPECRRLCPPQPCPTCDPEAYRRELIREGAEP